MWVWRWRFERRGWKSVAQSPATRVGHCLATFGRRSRGLARLGVWANLPRNSRHKQRTPAAAGARRALGAGASLLQDVFEIGRQQVAAFDSACPDPVRVRAEARILFAFEPAHAVAEVALSNLASLADRSDHGDRLVLSVLASAINIASPRSVSG